MPPTPASENIACLRYSDDDHVFPMYSVMGVYLDKSAQSDNADHILVIDKSFQHCFTLGKGPACKTKLGLLSFSLSC